MFSEGAGCEPRRDRGTGDPGAARARRRGGRRLLDRRPRRDARASRRPGGAHRSAAGCRQLPPDPVARRRGGHDRLRGGAPRLRLPGREPRLREACADNDLVFVGPPRAGDDADGRQGRSATGDARGRRARPCPGPTARPRSPPAREARRRSAIRCCSRRPPAAAARACASSRRRTSSSDSFGAAPPRPRRAFGDATLYVEKVVAPAATSRSRCSCDEYGNVLTLGERECSIQRRHQKLIEETPVAGAHARAARGDGGGRRARAAARSAT